MSTAADAPSIGFDVGGQSIKAVLAGGDGEVLAQASAPTGERTDAAALVAALGGLRGQLGEVARPEGPVGVGIAGVLDRAGALRGSPHLPLLVGSRIADTVAKGLGCGVVVHNDADCAAMAEGWNGAAVGHEDFLLVTIGTGVGSGLVLGGRLRAGSSGFGCEFGHTLVVHRGRHCGCGNLGCLEAYVSETAARGFVEESSAALQRRVAEARAAGGGGFAKALFDLGTAGDLEAEERAAGMVDILGSAIASAVNVLDLTCIVLGGGIAPAVLARLPRLRDSASRSLFARPIADLDLLAASHGPAAGAIGAARLAMLTR